MTERTSASRPIVAQTEVWAQLWLCAEDCARIRELLTDQAALKPSAVISNMHLTVYHARRFMQGLMPIVEPVKVVVPTRETRFMVLAPGGENPKPHLEPRHCKVGIRLQKRNEAYVAVQEYRNRVLIHETETVLGGRRPSTRSRNAFGARNFQPHVAFLRSGSRIERDLAKVGILFRNAMPSLTFDRFSVEIVRRDRVGNRIV